MGWPEASDRIVVELATGLLDLLGHDLDLGLLTLGTAAAGES